MNLSDAGASFLIVGDDHHGDLFATKILTVFSTANQTSWRKITCNSIDLIVTPDQLFWTLEGLIAASAITTSHHLKGLSGSSYFSFTAGGAASHVAIQNQYKNIFSSFPVTANVVYSQTATAYGLKTSVGRYFANRFVVADVP